MWAFAGWHLNVHVWGATAAGWTRMQVGSFDLGFAAVVGDHIEGLPWRVCARVEGPVLSVKLWAASQPEPAWSDHLHVSSVVVPAGWRNRGRVGWYAGHLKAGDFLVYDRIDAATLG